MRIILSGIFVAAVAFCSFSQSRVLNNPSNKSYFGTRLSLDLSIPGDITLGDIKTDALSPGPGLSFGFIYNAPLVANLYVEPGLDLYYNTSSITAEYLSNNDFVNQAFKNRSLRKFGMRLPVTFGYHFDFSESVNFTIFTGPVLDVGFSNDYYITTEEIIPGKDAHVSGSLYSDFSPVTYNRVDCKWRTGVGFNIGDCFLGLSGDIGLCNMINGKRKYSGKMKFRENIFKLTLGYNFR